MTKQVFLGGACGATTWRRDVAIPVLDAAGVSYHNPQLGAGEWTAAHEEFFFQLFESTSGARRQLLRDSEQRRLRRVV